MAPKPGTETEAFVHPERISSQLICPICTMVLENPVQTPTDHLFCEDELLEWMSRSTMCPVTNTPLDADSIRKPSRIILNMLAELERFCPNKGQGCDWIGENEHLASHISCCPKRPREQLLREIREKDEKIKSLRSRLAQSEKKCTEFMESNDELSIRIAACECKLKVYDAFFKQSETSDHVRGDSKRDDTESVLQRLSRLRQLETLGEG